MNTLQNLFTPEELQKYQALIYPFNVPMLKAAIDEQLTIDPDYEVFVPIVYYAYTKLVRKGKAFSMLQPPHILISNKGQICYRWAKGTETLSCGTLSEKGYWVVSLTQDKTRSLALKHRAMACTFLPVHGKFAGIHPKDLEVNHIDGIKGNFALGNLEWSDRSSNATHAYETGLIKIVTGEQHKRTMAVKGVVMSGSFQGYEFLLFGKADSLKNGFQQSNISLCVSGKQKQHLNCKFSAATKEEIENLPRGLTEEVRKDIFPS